MTREEKIDKILEMTKEIFLLEFDNIDDKELDKSYFEVKFTLETLKELKGVDNE